MATEAQFYALITCALCTYAFCLLYSLLYICRDSSTFVGSALQISSFMQNKANFRKSQMNVSIFSQKAYENNSNWTLGENKPNTKPIKANLLNAQINVNKVLTKNYENETLSGSGKNKANSKPNKANFRKAKMNVNVFPTKDYENILNWVICENKANIKPKQSQTKPIYRGVASGEDGSNPISKSYLKTRLYGLHVANESGNIVVQDHCEEIYAFCKRPL